MDSKSISLKGVGVQVPASAPHARAADELARALVPVLLHKLNNTTQYLGALQALLSDPSLEPMQARALDGLSSTALDVDDLGWMLGLIANASGANVLHERREATRLSALVRLVDEALRRERRGLVASDRSMPDLDVRSAQDAWQIPWAIARWQFTAARALPAGSALEWKLVEGTRPAIVCQVPFTLELANVFDELRARDVRFDRDPDDSVAALRLPAGALRWSERPS